MSISIVLVPVAIAAVSAWRASRPERDPVTGRTVIGVQTRMRDTGLLTLALSDMQAQVHQHQDGSLIAQWQNTQAHFHQDPDGVWQVDFTGAIDTDSATSIVTAIDAAYGRQVQQAVLARLRERAPLAGMNVASESTDDTGTITLVLDIHEAHA
ncbi:hypothetical protein [Gordonia sp. AC31]|uniref:hypothetical protein n=1 Tax=Gordonia sp. AC31 TaxID=2962571 RepID=UPI002880FF75|nr:hypothetical protein [Gordonia sp. AC31]MDT0223760.1 hypothetical protein [Gordonia sp. AC31]